jgi:hypothetical protein
MALENASRDWAGVHFCMKEGSKVVTCRVSGDALEDIEGVHQASLDYLAAFEAHRDEIEAAAKRNYKAKIIDPSGVVLVRSADLLQRNTADEVLDL